MSSHNLQTQLVETVSQVNVGAAATKGKLFYYVAGVPANGLTKYATGCLAIDVTATTAKLYINTGTNASATWTVVGAQTV